MGKPRKYHTEQERAEAKREYDKIYKRNRRSRRKNARISVGRTFDVPPGLFLDREARRAALERRTFSQAAFGDPPPGYSALDLRAAHGAKQEALEL